MSEKRMAFALRGEESDSIELDIYDVIGDDWWGGVSARGVLSRLKGQAKKTLKSRINSGGGDVSDGMAIYNLVKEHEGKTVAQIDGVAASMASVIALAFDEVHMASNAMFMIHNPWGLSIGEANDHRKTADLLDKMRLQISDIYVAKTGLDRDRVLGMMDDESWLTAEEAKSLGFVDSVKPAKKSNPKAMQAFARVDLTGFTKTPLQVATLVAMSQAQLSLIGSAPENQPAPSGQIPAGEENIMNEELKKLLAALGVESPEAAFAKATTLMASTTLLARIEGAIGASGEEALGAIRAAFDDSKKLASVTKELDELRAKREKEELDASFGKAHADRKITPHEETELRAQIEAKEMTPKGVMAYLAKRSPHPVLANQGQSGPTKTNGDAKGYEHLSSNERLKLQREDEESFKALRADWEKHGCPIVES